jgi:chloramphenicol 3-O-phosphotransferase
MHELITATRTDRLVLLTGVPSVGRSAIVAKAAYHFKDRKWFL